MNTQHDLKFNIGSCDVRFKGDGGDLVTVVVCLTALVSTTVWFVRREFF